MKKTEVDLFAELDALGIVVSNHEHAPLHTVEESKALRGTIPGTHCKSLFLKDKKDALWLVVAAEDTPVDLKRLPTRIGSARLSFGKPDLLWEVLGVRPGAVTPFALINDMERRMNVALDAGMMQADILNYHPLRNDMTTTIASGDLLRFIRAVGFEPGIVALDQD